MTNSLLLAVHAFASRVLMSFSVDETLLPRLVNLSTSFRELPTEKSTPNDEYENFVNAHLEAAEKYIPTKLKLNIESHGKP